MDLGTFNGTDWLLVGLSAVCIGMAKAGLGGLGMAAIVLMALVMPARESTGAILTMLITADIFAVVAFRRYVVWRVVWQLLPAAVLGIVTAFLLMPLIADEVFRPLLGWLLLALLGLMLIQRQRPGVSAWVEKNGFVVLVAGWLGGVTTMLANAAGPVMSIYLLACRLPKMEFVGTAAWFFFIVNLTKLPFSAAMGLVNPDSLLMTLAAAPLVIGGGFFGRWLLGRINQQMFESLILLFTVLAALRLIAG